jgi:hypothetical protein
MSDYKLDNEDLQTKVNEILDAIDELATPLDTAVANLRARLSAFDGREKNYTITYVVKSTTTYTMDVEARSAEDAQERFENGEFGDLTDGDEQDSDTELDEVTEVEEN